MYSYYAYFSIRVIFIPECIYKVGYREFPDWMAIDLDEVVLSINDNDVHHLYFE